jgi:hypothetical protein
VLDVLREKLYKFLFSRSSGIISEVNLELHFVHLGEIRPGTRVDLLATIMIMSSRRTVTCVWLGYGGDPCRTNFPTKLKPSRALE